MPNGKFYTGVGYTFWVALVLTSGCQILLLAEAMRDTQEDREGCRNQRAKSKGYSMAVVLLFIITVVAFGVMVLGGGWSLRMQPR